MEDYIKKKIRSLKPSATLAINEKSKKLLEDGRRVFRFGFGQSPFPVPKGVISALKKNADKKNYLSTQGLVELRKAISIYLAINFDNLVRLLSVNTRYRSDTGATEKIFQNPAIRYLFFNLRLTQEIVSQIPGNKIQLYLLIQKQSTS